MSIEAQTQKTFYLVTIHCYWEGDRSRFYDDYQELFQSENNAQLWLRGKMIEWFNAAMQRECQDRHSRPIKYAIEDGWVDENLKFIDDEEDDYKQIANYIKKLANELISWEAENSITTLTLKD